MLSTGRTGTKKLGQVFSRLPGKRIIAEHQVDVSRKVNILANMRWAGLPVQPVLFETLHRWINRERDCDLYINTDPLISCAMTEDIIQQYGIYLIHVVRHPLAFAQSFTNLQFSRLKSFLAHNFVPFWQPMLRPFEHVMHLYDRDYLIRKYLGVWLLKNQYFYRTYGHIERYMPICFERLFDPSQSASVINHLLERMNLLPCEIDFDFFHRKSNISTAKYIRRMHIENYSSATQRAAVRFYEEFKSICIG